MRTQTLVVAGAAVAAAAATSSSANTSPNPLAQVLKRQVEIGEECQAALADSVDIIQTIPEPPTDPEFLEFLSGQTAPENLGDCELPAVSGDPAQASVYSSYIAEVTQWVGENGDALMNLVSVCATEPVFSEALESMSLPVPTGTICSEYSFVSGAASDPTSSPSSSGSAGGDDDSSSSVPETSSGSSPSPTSGDDSAETTSSGGGDPEESDDAAESSGTESPAAAPRQTGMAVAAMAVAGLAVAGIY